MSIIKPRAETRLEYLDRMFSSDCEDCRRWRLGVMIGGTVVGLVNIAAMAGVIILCL